jgi:hypothetical protein
MSRYHTIDYIEKLKQIVYQWSKGSRENSGTDAAIILESETQTQVSRRPRPLKIFKNYLGGAKCINFGRRFERDRLVTSF